MLCGREKWNSSVIDTSRGGNLVHGVGAADGVIGTALGNQGSLGIRAAAPAEPGRQGIRIVDPGVCHFSVKLEGQERGGQVCFRAIVAPGGGKRKGNSGFHSGAEVVVSQLGDTVVSNDTIQGSMACISASSEHPLEALKVLELVSTDTTFRDMLVYGEEGVNFEYVQGANGEQRVHKINTDWTMAAYTQGTFMTMTPTDDVEQNPYTTEVDEQNKNAISSVALGFNFDKSPVADKIAACQAIFEEYKGLLQTGTGEPEATVAEMMGKMRASGFDDIVAEAQAQLDAYLAG